MKGSTKNVKETCPSRGGKCFNWIMKRVTTGRDPSHEKDKQMVRDRRQKQKVLTSKEAAGRSSGQDGQLSWVWRTGPAPAVE